MALLFIDSFDHYQAAEITKKYTSGGALITAGAGRCGTAALEFNGGGYVQRGMLFGSNTVICGFAWKQDSSLSLGGSSLIALMSNEGTHCAISKQADGSIRFTSPADPVPVSVSSAPGLLHMDTWYYIELKVLLHDSAGTAEVRINNVTVLTYSGQTNGEYPTGISYAPIPLPPEMFHANGESNNHTWIDDLYILDGSGPAPWNTFLGDCRVEYLKPRANGALQEWPTVVGAAHWFAVNDNATPDEDGSYVEANAANLTDTYRYDPTGLPTGQPVYGAQLSLYAEKTETGPRVIAPVMNTVVGPPNYGPSYLSYQYYTVPYATNPATGLAWTVATINAIDAGVKVIS